MLSGAATASIVVVAMGSSFAFCMEWTPKTSVANGNSASATIHEAKSRTHQSIQRVRVLSESMASNSDGLAAAQRLGEMFGLQKFWSLGLFTFFCVPDLHFEVPGWWRRGTMQRWFSIRAWT